ncbi:MAG: MFS transporter [Rectinemataceae bacterium]|nr:MFS transporter [Rectinemataceae bacterium]
MTEPASSVKTGEKTGASRISAFLGRLPRDWIVTASRTSIFRLFYQMLIPYLSIYTLGLGATGADLGLVNCAGMAAAAILCPFTGWLMDRIGPKRIYLGGIALLALSWLIYGLAQSWPIIIFATVTYYIGFRTSGHSCSVICANSLPTADRATAMSCCESLAAGALGIIGPLAGAFIVTRSGGMTVAGIRPLFFLSLAGTAVSFVLVRSKLSDCRWGSTEKRKMNFLADISELFRHGKHLKKLIVISVISQLPQGMIIPFTQPFAARQGAKEFVLGAMVTGFALTPLLIGIPAGRLSDRIGRKRVLFMLTPVFWASCLLLIFARSDIALILAGVLQGSLFVCGVLTAALIFELVEPQYMGRWIGVVGFFQMGTAAIVTLISGIIWDRIGPQYVFLIPIALDIFIKMPLLICLPEKRRLRSDR